MRSQKVAKALVEVGAGGPRAFARAAGHELEIVPMQDPSTIHAGRALSLRVLFRAQPLANAYLRAGIAPPDSAPKAARPDTIVTTAGDGVAHLQIVSGGLWNVRRLHAAPADAAAGSWDVLFATLVFRARGGHGEAQ